MFGYFVFSRKDVDVIWENSCGSRAIFSCPDGRVAYAKILCNGLLDRITPFVKEMKYDKENDVIEVIDSLDETGKDIYYYINTQGMVLTMAYTSEEKTFFGIEYIGENDSYAFEGYVQSKRKIDEYFEKKETNNKDVNHDNCLKMAKSSKNNR